MTDQPKPPQGVSLRQYLKRITAADAAITDAEDRLTAAVMAARAVGCSWEDIGAALGVTRQSAHRRFARPEDGAA